jgi:outer membrane receptor protein involved in Fe transport
MRLANLLASTILVSAIAIPGGASAQTGQAPVAGADQGETASSGDNGAVSEIVITGSRVRRDGYTQPTPVTTVTSEQLLRAAPTDIATALNQLPQFSSSTTRSFCCQPGSFGNFYNLRGLGAARTLVLLDGDRLVATTDTGLVDANLLPDMLVQRIDVVTGGASAAYGSDAVSGVVNYIIDRKRSGLRVELQGGTNTYGHDKNYKIGIAGGTDFAEGRGHFVFGVQRFASEGILSQYDMPRAEPSLGFLYTGDGSANGPYRAVYGAVNSSLTSGGIITQANGVPIANSASPLAGIVFLPNGGYRAAVVGNTYPGSSPVFRDGGDGSVLDTPAPFPKLSTNKIYARMDYALSDKINLSARFIGGESRTFQPFLAEREAAASAFTIFRDNAYLPAGVGTLMDNAGVTSFRMGRFNREFGRQTNVAYNNSFDGMIGLDGKFGQSWTWQASYSRGQSRTDTSVTNNATLPNLFAAADAVRDPVSGNIVCRVTLTNPGVFPGCVPINLFGAGSISQAGINYIIGQSSRKVSNTQDIAAFTVQGPLLSLPAGSLSVAFGGEYRKRSLYETADVGSTTQINATGILGFPTTLCPTATTCRFGVHSQGNFGPADAKDTVKELFGEFVLPVFKSSTLGESLELNGAIRRTDYSNSGIVYSWKLGADYSPMAGLRLRATRSKDIRAPNLFELFQGPVISFVPGIVDPVTGLKNLTLFTNTVGNPTLRPETGDTLTLGAVFSPPSLPGFSGSIDYYDVRIKNALALIGVQPTINNCAAGDSVACGRITRDPSGNITQVLIQNINVANRQTKGIDFDFSYAFQLGSGNARIRAIANRLIKFVDSNQGVTTDYTGNVSVLDKDNAGPKWRGNLIFTYDVGNFSLFAQERFIGAASIRPPSPAASNYVNPHLPAVFYSDVTLTYKMPKARAEVFLTVNNIFDAKPPFMPSQLQPGLEVPTNFNFYNWEYRYFTAGVRYSF